MTSPTAAAPADIDALVELVRHERDQVLPFVGSGLTVAAGAPTVPQLARELATRAGLRVGAGELDLLAVADAADGQDCMTEVRRHLADIFTGLRLRPTPALTAICGTPGRRVLTTNYDDAIERAARDRGLIPVSLHYSDKRIGEPLEAHELHVIHLHGLPEEPDSLILPGTITATLMNDDVFNTFVRAVMAPSKVLYLGFSFTESEPHLRSVARWLSGKLKQAHPQFLVLDEREAMARVDELARLQGSSKVIVVPYEADEEHTAAERVAVALAPRDDDELTWVEPPLLRVGDGENEESLQRRGLAFDWNTSADVSRPRDLLEDPACLLVGGPGIGKTTLLERLQLAAEDRPVASAHLRDFQPRDPVEDGIGHLLRDVQGEPLPVEDLAAGGGLMLIDGLDEVGLDANGASLRDAAVTAVMAALDRWPETTWVASSRPGPAADALTEAGVATYRMFASRAWAERYLETRGVPPKRREAALLDGYGLGDLLAIPLFAKRLADRLLLEDVDPQASPLELLVEEQLAATRREAARQHKASASLDNWMRRVAVSLELRGLTSVPSQDVMDLQTPDGVDGHEARRRLVDASLLADSPGRTAFPTKTLQQGLCADTIANAPDVAAAVAAVAAACIGGRDRLRDDIEFTLDLVFEHADRNARQSLRQLDELRWARTVHTRGSATDAEQAFDLLLDWHARRGLPLASIRESGLRTTQQALATIAHRWPEVVAARRDELERDLESDQEATRSRALDVLGDLPKDDRVATWLLPRLNDDAPHLVAQAAAIAARLRLDETKDALYALLDAQDDRIRGAALQALVVIVPVADLPKVAARCRGRDLRYISKKLDERLDLDTGLDLVKRLRWTDETAGWLLTRIVETAHEYAWTPARVEALLSACRNGGPGLNHSVVGRVAAKHPEAAIAAIQLSRVGDAPYGPRGQLLPLQQLPAEVLQGDKLTDLRHALARALEEEREIRDRNAGPKSVEDLLDEHGLDVDPEALIGRLIPRTLSKKYRVLLERLVNRWWTADGLRSRALEDRSASTLALLTVGPAIVAPLSERRWWQLFDARISESSSRLARFDNDGIWWLQQAYASSYDARVVQRISNADGEQLATIALISGAGRTGALTAAVAARLRQLGPDAPRWSEVARILVDNGAVEEVGRLRSVPMPPAVAGSLDRALAHAGNGPAQRRLLDTLADGVEAGEKVERPAFLDLVETPATLAALARLARAALESDHDVLRAFALGKLGAWSDTDVLAVIDGLVDAYADVYPWVALTAEDAARRLATEAVLGRLPSTLVGVIDWFEPIVTRR